MKQSWAQGLAWILLHAGLVSLLSMLLSKWRLIHSFWQFMISELCNTSLSSCLADTEHCCYCTLFHYPTLFISLIVIIKLLGYSCKQRTKYSFLSNTFHLNNRDEARGVTIYFSCLTFWIKRAVLVNPLFRWSWYLWKFTRELPGHSRTSLILNKDK